MKATLLFLLFFCIIIDSGHAQVGYAVEHYTSENGLPQNSVKSIVADSEGFIWLATEDGLVRYDGHVFYLYNDIHLNKSNRRVAFIRSRVRDTSPLGTGRNKISYASLGTGDIVKIESGIANIDTVYDPKWLQNMRRVKLDPTTVLEATGFPSNIGLGPDFEGRYKISVGNDDNTFYICEKERVTYYSQWSKKYVMKYSSENQWNFFSIGSRLYYFHNTGFITTIIDKKQNILPISGDILSHKAYKNSNRKFQLFWNSNSDQAFIYFEKNTYLLEQQSDGSLVTRLLFEEFDLNSRVIEQIYFDKASHKIFLGSRIQGLFILTKQQFESVNFKGNDLQNVFYAQIPYDRNSVLTANGLIVGREPFTKKNIVGRIPIIDSLYNEDRRVLLRDRKGGIWIKSGEKLFYLDNQGNQVRQQWKLDFEIKTLHEGINGQIWFSVINKGLYMIDPEDHSWAPKLVLKSSKMNITYLESMNSNRLLLGTDNGLYMLDISRGKVRLIQKTKGWYIKSIYVSASEQIWFTSVNVGLSFINNGEIISFPLDKNKYLSSPHCIVNDGRGYFWIPTNRGLFQMSINDLLLYAKEKALNMKELTHRAKDVDLYYIYHTKEEGFNTNEFNGNCQPCAAILANGHISLPSINGLVWYDPRHISNYSSNGAIILDEIGVSKERISFLGDTIHLPMTPENIELHFTTAYLGNSYNLNLSYVILDKGKEPEKYAWVPIDNSDFTVRFSSLHSGEYTLLIRKLSGFGLNNYTIKRLHVIVPPHWYETAWALSIFSLAFIACLILIIYFYSNYRLAAAARENKKLEEIIIQRTASLEQALLVVEESKDEMAQQIHLFSRLVASISHDVQSPLRYIAFASQKIPDMIEMKQLDRASKLGTTIFDLSDRMSTMLVDLLDFIKVTVYGKRMDFEDIHLKKLVDTKMELFKNVVDRNDSYLLNDVPADLTVFSNYQFLSIIIHNLIDNAAKYTYNGHVRIYVGTDTKHRAELVISNTGRGIPLQMIETINSPIEDDNLENLMESGTVTGLGLLIVKEVGKLAGITIKVSQTDVTSFHLFFE